MRYLRSPSIPGRLLITHFIKMDRLQVWPAEISANRVKAIEDARQMQQRVIEACNKAGKAPPKYKLEELIGKGSFGRVFKS